MILSARDLTTGYGASTVIYDLSCEFEAGEIVSIVGANGAGKTTLLRCFAGLLPARRGRIEFDGTDITKQSARRRVRAGLVLCPESRQLFPSLTVAENLRLGALAVHGAPSMEATEHVMDLFPILRSRSTQKAGTLSGGEQQMVAVARALMARPRVLMLDEPTLGLAVGAVDALASVIHESRNRDSLTYVITEQNPLLPQLVSDRLFSMTAGQLSVEPLLEAGGEDLSRSFFDRALRERERRPVSRQLSREEAAVDAEVLPGLPKTMNS